MKFIRVHGWNRLCVAAALVLLIESRPMVFAQASLDVSAHLHIMAPEGGRGKTVPAKQRVPTAIWLAPVHPSARTTAVPNNSYTLTQRNKQFIPHLLIVPMGSVVRFPNADPFFHNVFSLFDGRRFDLGLYEAGSAKEVNFFREGVSYIFCNIHPEMSAVVIALSTPFYSVANERGDFLIRGVPPGAYTLHVWVEGVNQAALDKLTRPIQIGAGGNDLGEISTPPPSQPSLGHDNKFEQPYDKDEPSTY